MRRFFTEMNPTLRGFLIIAIVAAVVVVLQLQQTLIALGMIMRIVFILAIAVVLYLLWRDRLRHEIETWPSRAQIVFYAATGLVVVDLGVFFLFGASGLGGVAFLLTIAIAGFAMFRTWREQRAYGGY